jgi:two-component system phosphate regulon response regulator PhoB
MMTAPTPGPTRRAPSRTTTILVVDDNDDTRHLLRAMFERGAHRVVEAEDGLEALTLIERLPLDLIVLDVNLPGADGPEVCRRVKSNPATRAVPVVMLTAATDEEDRRRGLAAGADAYLTKPFSPLALLDLLDKHLGPR